MMVDVNALLTSVFGFVLAVLEKAGPMAAQMTGAAGPATGAG